MSKRLADRPNGSLSVQWSYFVERGHPDMPWYLPDGRSLVEKTIDMELELEQYKKEFDHLKRHNEEHKVWHEGCALCG